MKISLQSSFVPAVLALSALLPAQTGEQDHVRANVFGQMKWKELGPVIYGGRIVDIAVHPTNPAVFWVAAASGGIWQTQNGGISFEPQFQDAYSISIGDIAVAPSNGDVLYLGTGEANNQRSSYWGNGVHKSTDGGKTWTHVGLNGTDHIGRVVVHPHNPDVVWVAALGALYTANPERGLYKTEDGGKTWEHAKNLGPDVGFVDVVVDPQNPDTLYAASYERRRRAWHLTEGGEGSRLWKSTDGGDTWAKLTGGLPGGTLGRIGIDVSAADPRIVYANIENLNPRGESPKEPEVKTDAAEPREPRGPEGGGDGKAAEADAETLADPVAAREFFQQLAEAQDPERRPRKPVIGGEVWRSDDAGNTWKKTNGATAVGGNPGYYYGQIRVDPVDANIVYVLSVPVFRSTDGGKTWQSGGGGGGGRRGNRGDGESRSFAPGLHVDHHALWIDPKDGNHCILGNDGGLAITWDGGKAWDHINRLPISQYYAIAVDLRDNYRVYGGTQDNGSWGFPIRGATSSGLQILDTYRINGGDGFYVCCDPTDPDTVYSESQFGGMSRQNLRTGENKGIQPRADKGGQPLRWNWSTPMLLSPHSAHTLYVGSQHLHRSRDRGDHWTTISPDLTTNDADKKKGNVPHCTITTIAESPRQEGCLWVGTDDGRVWNSKDGGGRWTEMTDRFPAEVRGLWVSRVAASTHDAETALVAFTGYREDNRRPFLFRTDDGGETFRSIANDLPQEPINVIRQHPRRANVLLVGTEMGAYVSIDDGASWHPLGSNLPRCAVHDLLVHPREAHVLVGTHGRGIWALDAPALEQCDTAVLGKAFHAFPPSDGVLLRRGQDRGNFGARRWSASNPFTAPVFRFYLAEDSETKVKVEVLDAKGTTLFSEEVEAKAGYHERAWGGAGGRGGRGQGGGGFPGFSGRGGAGGIRAGQFAVRITHGEASSVQPFKVTDLRGPRTLLGGTPGIGSLEGEEFEAGMTGEGEAAGEAEGERRHGGR